MDKKQKYGVIGAILLLFIALMGYFFTQNKPSNPWEGLNTATAPGNVTCGDTLDTAGGTYTMNASSNISGASCFVVSAANVTLDCNGYSITGNNASSTYGVTSTVFNTTVKNCKISNFSTAIYFNGATNGTIQNNTLNTTRAYGYPNGISLAIGSNADSNRVFNNTMTSFAGFAVILYTSNDLNVFSGNTLNGSYTTYGGTLIYTNGLNNTFANNTIYGRGGTYAFTIQGSADNNLIYNNTFGDATTSVYIASGSTGNTFYWNNFTGTSGVYLSDAANSNFYNKTVGGKNEGNIWHNVMNGSVNITGANISGFGGSLYIGSSGSDYPYNNSTSSGKFSCNFTGCADYAPLFYSSPVSANVSTSYGSGITALLFNASTYVSKNVSATNQSATTPLFVVNCTANCFVTTNIVCNQSPSLSGLSVKCAASFNTSAAKSCNNSAVVFNLSTSNYSNVWCWADFYFPANKSANLNITFGGG